jgi:hypothetical protein
VLDAPERAADVPPAAVPAILGALAELQATFTLRLMSGANGHAPQSEAPASPDEPDRYLTVEEAAAIYNVPKHYFYRRVARIPGARRLSRKCLRLSESGLRRFMASRKV